MSHPYAYGGGAGPVAVERPLSEAQQTAQDECTLQRARLLNSQRGGVFHSMDDFELEPAPVRPASSLEESGAGAGAGAGAGPPHGGPASRGPPSAAPASSDEDPWKSFGSLPMHPRGLRTPLQSPEDLSLALRLHGPAAEDLPPAWAHQTPAPHLAASLNTPPFSYYLGRHNSNPFAADLERFLGPSSTVQNYHMEGNSGEPYDEFQSGLRPAPLLFLDPPSTSGAGSGAGPSGSGRPDTRTPAQGPFLFDQTDVYGQGDTAGPIRGEGDGSGPSRPAVPSRPRPAAAATASRKPRASNRSCWMCAKKEGAKKTKGMWRKPNKEFLPSGWPAEEAEAAVTWLCHSCWAYCRRHPGATKAERLESIRFSKKKGGASNLMARREASAAEDEGAEYAMEEDDEIVDEEAN